jgi:predicted transcriptional regulator
MTGIRPQDIVVLLKIILWEGKTWQNKDLAQELFLSTSEISDSLMRCQYAKLLDHSKHKVMRHALYELIRYGLPYFYASEPGAITQGMLTAHSHPYMSKMIPSETKYVWPDPEGHFRGQSIEPLYPKQVEAAKMDDMLYEILAMIDVCRVGKNREKKMADPYLQKHLIPHEQTSEH